MELIVIGGGMFDSNSYLVIEENEAILVDAGVSSAKVLDSLQKKNAGLKYIFLTHGHIDHICSADALRKSTGAKVLIHHYDADCMTNGERNLSSAFLRSCEYDGADEEFDDGDEYTFGRGRIKVIHTPGHSRGGCCFLYGDILFSGDTLFAGSIGRTDFQDGNYSELIASIKSRLFVLPDKTRVYPGHGGETSIIAEKRSNPFLNM